MISSEVGSDPLTGSSMSDGGSGDASSVSSQRSAGGRSLLERIQMQRQRDAEASQESGPPQPSPPMTVTTTTTTTPQQIQIPNYGPMPPGIGNTPVPPAGAIADGSFLTQAWSSPSPQGMGGASTMGMSGAFMSEPVSTHVTHHLEDGISDALLPPSARLPSDEYSMSDYFMTFVRDVTGLFSRLHIVPRILLFAALLYMAIKLL